MLPLAAGLALARALERLGVRADLKWPNDLLVGGRKIAGVLCESRRVRSESERRGSRRRRGRGRRTSPQAREDFPPSCARSATSLAIEGCARAREDVAAEFLNALEPLWDELEEGEPRRGARGVARARGVLGRARARARRRPAR